MQELKNKGYWLENLSPTENFIVNTVGLTWLYNPYEIAPYAMGTTQITLSYNQIMPYIYPIVLSDVYFNKCIYGDFKKIFS